MRKIIIIAVVLFAFSCATQRIFYDAKIEQDSFDLPLREIISLEKRVKSYWDARLKNDWAKAYKYEDPEVKKKAKLTLSKYIQTKAPWIEIKNYDVKKIQVLNPNKVRVYLIIDASIDLPIGGKREERVLGKDIWLKRNGKWYRFLVLNPFHQVPIGKSK